MSISVEFAGEFVLYPYFSRLGFFGHIGRHILFFGRPNAHNPKEELTHMPLS